MWNALCLLLGGLTYPLQLAPGSFPRALTRQEETEYLEKSRQGDLEARNKLIEHNLRLVAHITNNGQSKRMRPVNDKNQEITKRLKLCLT